MGSIHPSILPSFLPSFSTCGILFRPHLLCQDSPLNSSILPTLQPPPTQFAVILVPATQSPVATGAGWLWYHTSYYMNDLCVNYL